VYQALSNEPHRQSYFSSDQGGKTGVMPKHNAFMSRHSSSRRIFQTPSRRKRTSLWGSGFSAWCTSHLNTDQLSALINENGYSAQALVKDKIGISIKALFTNKKVFESKKEIAFTDKSIQEISYDLGYQDPGYFNRVFKKQIISPAFSSIIRAWLLPNLSRANCSTELSGSLPVGVI